MEKYRFSEEQRDFLEKSRLPLAIYQFIDKRVVTLVLSAGFCDLFGYDDPAEAYYDMDNNMYKDTHPDDAARIADAAIRFATRGGKYEVIYRSKKKDGSGYNVIHAIGEHIYTDTGVRLAQVWYTDEGSYTTDAGAKQSGLSKSLSKALHEESILQASYYDYLTGLPSMTNFFELAASARDRFIENGDCPVLLFMDMSGLKFFNSRHGFAEGDRLLQSFAKVLARTFGSENCSRFGQDHFAVLTKEACLEEILEKLFEECETINDGRSLPVRVGIYSGQMEAVDISTACDRAKAACDKLRSTYKSGFSYFSQALRDDVLLQQEIIENLDRAIAEGWIKVYYQPIVRAVNRHVCDEEALSRWIDPVRGCLSPAQFIPVLEESGLIYKLDLYVIDQVLRKLRTQADAGLHLVPQSVNLSRADFDACDIVEEIRRRVDDAGLGRDMLTIEITESIIGSDFEFMKQQVDRFRALGFQVWMDDFGSGYSSLDVLQSIRFDLIKFDMHFMQQLDEGNSGKIILTELMRMATALGIDTVCEGVETETQVRFLAEIGCAKLQGFYFGRPIPFEQILERYARGTQIGFEDPRESRYYEAIGRVNLYDLTMIAQEDINALHNFFDILPMAIVEATNGRVRLARSNPSYREFMRRRFDIDPDDASSSDQLSALFGSDSAFMKRIRQCCRTDNRAFIDEKMPDGATMQFFVRRIAENPVTGTIAIAVAMLSIIDSDQGTTYANLARALAADYFNLYYVDIESGDFIEYTSDVGEEAISMERHGTDFFRTARRDALDVVYEDDRQGLISVFTKENILRQIETQGTFTFTYRLLIGGEPVYVNMKAMRMRNDSKHIIIGVSNVDSQMRQKALLDQIRQDQISYSRIMALSRDYICIYTVDPKTDRYREYNAASVYEGLGLAKSGDDFFGVSQALAKDFISPPDLPKYRAAFTKENVLREIRENGLFAMRYHLMIDGRPQHVGLKAVLVKENSEDLLIVGVISLNKDQASQIKP